MPLLFSSYPFDTTTVQRIYHSEFMIKTAEVRVLDQTSKFRVKFTTPVESMKGNAAKPEMKVTVQPARGQEPEGTSL
jgi:hypothetical protein